MNSRRGLLAKQMRIHSPCYNERLSKLEPQKLVLLFSSLDKMEKVLHSTMK